MVTLDTKAAIRGTRLPTFGKLIEHREGTVQGEWAGAVTFCYFKTYNLPPTRCQRECRGFESHHPLRVTGVVHERQRRISFDVGASYDDSAARFPRLSLTHHFANK